MISLNSPPPQKVRVWKIRLLAQNLNVLSKSQLVNWTELTIWTSGYSLYISPTRYLFNQTGYYLVIGVVYKQD